MALLQKTLETDPPDGSTHWSCRSMAKATDLSKSTVQRIWSAFNVQPHRQKTFKLSTDPFLVEKVHDIVAIRRGLLLLGPAARRQDPPFHRRYNPQAVPFMWTATADSIIQKLERLCQAISGTGH